MSGYVLRFEEVDRTQVPVVGGKGAHLGDLSRVEGVRVPPGFCITTEAFRRIVAEAPSINEQLDALAHLKPEDRDAIRTQSAELRGTIERIAIPEDLAKEITRAVTLLGDAAAYAVRSSATAEDLPDASFAGQQDTYLNVVGTASILDHVRRCWASLFTERAVTYRLHNGFDHRKVQMAVVVQQMVFPEASGILFTADPVSSNRKVATVEAVFGLGEALVSGLVNADVHQVRDGAVVSRSVAAKERALYGSPSGGTQERAIEPERQDAPALTDEQVVRLVELGRRIEAHFGAPQDIEWCLAGEAFHIVQARPITTLFPVPAAADNANRVYLSVGHQQMMTDPMRPLGLSVFQLTAARPMFEAGGRLFVDVTAALGSLAGRTALMELAGKSDPLIRDALETIVERGNFIPLQPAPAPSAPPARATPPPLENDPAIVAGLVRGIQDSLAVLERDIQSKSGTELFDFILADIGELKRLIFEPRTSQAIMAGIEASWWLNDKLLEWLGEKNAADTLTLSAPNNVTSEMGLALLDVADVIRPHPEVVAFLERVTDDGFLDALPSVPGGHQAREALETFLDKYGMRCVGEIDLTRPRWRETPSALVPVLLGNIRNFEPGAGKRRFDEGVEQARQKEQEVLQRLRALPDGERKAEETKRMIDRVRTFIGFREYPKYGIVSRFFLYKQALLRETERLVRTGAVREKEDLFFLTFQELREAVRTQQVDGALIQQRKDAFRTYQPLTPPRVLTSEGECLAGAYRRNDFPAGALVGLAVSSGTSEGRARVILDIAQANLEPGDILVTAYTDPSWTPLFVAMKALVTEVGGLMSHGAVIAREYGLPAVVGVQHATRRIRDGQRIRVDGTNGYVQILA